MASRIMEVEIFELAGLSTALYTRKTLVDGGKTGNQLRQFKWW